MSSFFAELGQFLKTRKLLVLVPFLLIVIGIALLLILFARNSALAPFIYAVNASHVLRGMGA